MYIKRSNGRVIGHLSFEACATAIERDRIIQAIKSLGAELAELEPQEDEALTFPPDGLAALSESAAKVTTMLHVASGRPPDRLVPLGDEDADGLAAEARAGVP